MGGNRLHLRVVVTKAQAKGVEWIREPPSLVGTTPPVLFSDLFSNFISGEPRAGPGELYLDRNCCEPLSPLMVLGTEVVWLEISSLQVHYLSSSN